MALEVEATFENGVFKPRQPLLLEEHEVVVLTVKRKPGKLSALSGMMPWTDDPEILRKIAEDDEFSVRESP